MADHARFVDENLKRNYRANFIHGVLGMTGFRLIYAPTIIPAYLLLLTGSTAAVGLGSALLQLGATISPIASGARIEHRSHILPYAIRVGSMMRLMILGLALTGYFLTGNVLLFATFACFLMLGFFTGAQRVAFQMLMSKLIPIRQRGRLQGYRNFAGGLIAAVLAWAAGNYLIADKWLGNGYATTFLFAFLLTSAGLIVLKTMIREPAAPASRPQMPMRERIRQFPELLHDRDFAWFLVVQCFATMARVGAPFWTIYAGTQLGLDGALIGGLSFVFLGSDTVSNIFWGPLGDRWGFKIIYVFALASSILGVTTLIIGNSAVPIYAAFVLLGLDARVNDDGSGIRQCRRYPDAARIRDDAGRRDRSDRPRPCRSARSNQRLQAPVRHCPSRGDSGPDISDLESTRAPPPGARDLGRVKIGEEQTFHHSAPPPT